MSFRFPLLILTLGVAACTAATTPTTTTVSTTTTVPVPAPVEPSYGFAPGQAVTYDVSVRQDITFTAEGDAAGLGDETLPIDADVVSENVGTSVYTVTNASDSSVTLDITADFPETRVTGTVNGEPLGESGGEGGVASDLSRIQPVATTVVLDRRGTLVDDGATDLAATGADLAALAGLTNDLFSVPVGPAFPSRPIGLGDDWETIWERPGQDQTVTVASRSRVTEHTERRLVVESQTTTGAQSADFSQQFRDLFLAFAELDTDIPPELEDQLDQIEFSIEAEPSTVIEVAAFDLERRMVSESTKTATLHLTMVFRAPDEDGEIRGFEIRLVVTQTAVFTLRS
ncbi:MAG: hypothetical protein ACLGHX_11090 [Acidimicrobiia bacterium]